MVNMAAALVAAAATVIGVFLYTSVPTRLGLYSRQARRDPMLVGMTPAFHHGTKWNYTFEELRSRDLTGRRAVVTGASSGIGLAMSELLARQGAHVTMACRSRSKCESKAGEIRLKLSEERGGEGGGDVARGYEILTMTMDTSSLKSVRRFADDFVALVRREQRTGDAAVPTLDILFLNAGTFYNPNATHPCVPLSDDGIEYVFETNYLGHHLLYRLLEPLLMSQPNEGGIATVVQTSSASSFKSYTYNVATDLETLNGCKESIVKGRANLSYGQSKLAQVVWVKALTKRLGPSANVIANAFHPGFVDTKIFEKIENIPKWMERMIKYLARTAGWSPAEGALTGLFLGIETDRLVKDEIRGKYFHPMVNEVNNHLADDEELQNELWEFSDSLVKGYL